MKLGLHQSARMEQRLVQSPQMIQAMQILQLPTLDLVGRVEQELLENPFLELVESTESKDDEDGRRDEAQPEDGDQAERDRMIEDLERYDRDFGDSARSRFTNEEASDRKLEAMQNTAAAPQTLAEELIEQLAILDLDARHRDLAEYLIYSLDDKGYLAESLEEMAEAYGVAAVTADDVAMVLDDLRRIAHPAIGAHDLKDSLLLQIDALPVEDSLVRTLVEDHLEDITTNRLPRIAKATGASIEEVKDAIDAIRHLDPYPGSAFGSEMATVITPDVVVEEVDGRYEVRLTRARVPELTVSRTYRKMLGEISKGDAGYDFLRKRYEAARWFIDALHQRQSTLERIARAIFERQQEFLERGIKALHPLRMQEVADIVGVHISTVSRAVSGKYAQTPRGTYALKFFFTGGTEKETGEVASQVSIKQCIKELVEAEDRSHPLSDDQLAHELEEKHGIKIARRTVTKYRKALSIPASTQRKEF